MTTAKELAAYLEKLGWTDHIFHDEQIDAMYNGLVVAFRAPESIFAFRGAYYANTPLHGGGDEIHMKGGVMMYNCSLGEQCPYLNEHVKDTQSISIYCDNHIESSMPSEPFVLHDTKGEGVTTGIVFKISDIQ